CRAEKDGVSCGAACPVAAHAADGAVAVDIEHGEIALAPCGRVLNEDDSVGADAVVAIAEGDGHATEISVLRTRASSPIETDKVISGTIELVKEKSHCAALRVGRNCFELIPSGSSAVGDIGRKRILNAFRGFDNSA